jgi:sucrose-phosphate synthase
LENLLNSGMSKREIEKRYKISRRIDAEETTIFLADRIITSTNDEIKKQYSRYDNMQEDKFIVIPPAIDLDHFFSYKEQREWDEESRIIRTDIRDELWKFFTNMYKPIIFSLCRPEKRKNISGLIEAYGEDKELQERANLAIFAGIRKDIQKMEDAEKEVLTEMLLLMDKYNLYGKMAIPKRHDVDEEVPEMYRIAAESQGVFVNSAFSENFGLTLIEAAASGLPVVATNDGGPRDIIKNLKNGVLVNVEKSSNIAKGIKKILSDEKLWNDYSRNGINNINDYYSWEAHTATYIRAINKLMKEHEINPKTFISTGKKLFKFKKLMMFDIDDTILGNEKAVKRLKEVLENRGETVGFGVATGRTIESACKVLDENDFIKPDIIVSSVGSEIYYRNHDDYVFSTGWEAHISYLWKREEIIETLKDIKFLEYQPEENQRKYKVSYNFDGDEEKARQVARILVQNKLKVNLIVSHGSYIDILPFRASKGRGIRYIAYRWNIPHNRILVAGDSGNDTDMLTGELLGIVVANYSPELEDLKNNRKIYFASKKYADGVIEGINYYEFLT